jgi:hypothetical protein
VIRKWPFLKGVVSGTGVALILFGFKTSPLLLGYLQIPHDPTVSLSSYGLIGHIREHMTFMIPEAAYDVQYLNYGFQDYTDWCAFSVDEEDLNKIEAKYASAFAEEEPKASPKSDKVPQPLERYQPVLWWPKEGEHLKMAEFETGWMGIDTKTHRVYYYSFSR